MKVLFIPLLLLSLSGFAQSNDSSKIVQLVKDDYATMATMDIAAHIKNVTKDYILIERGQLWPLEMELDSIYRNPALKNMERKDYFEFKKVVVSGNMAYAIWHLKSDFRQNNSTRTKLWNESGVFQKVNGQWKIALIHSSVAPEQ